MLLPETKEPNRILHIEKSNILTTDNIGSMRDYDTSKFTTENPRRYKKTGNTSIEEMNLTINYHNLILENIEEFVVIADDQLNILYINKSGPSIPREKMIGSNLLDMIDDANKTEYIAFIEEIRSSKQPQYFSYSSRGGLFLRVRGSIIEGANNQPLFLLVNTNLTDFVKRYTKKGTEKRYSFTGISCVLLLDKYTKIISAGKEFAKYIGLNDPVEGKYLADLIVSNSTTEPTPRNIQEFNYYQLLNLKNFDRSKDSTIVDIEIQETMLQGNRYWLANIMPIDERNVVKADHKNIADIFNKQKLNTLGLLSGKIAHDFRNILMGLSGVFYMVRSEHSQQSSIENEIGTFKNILAKGKDLTDQILKFASEVIEEDKILIQPYDAIYEMSALLEIVADENKLEIKEASNCFKVLINPSHFQQLMMNLVTNAVDAMETQGTITVTFDCIQYNSELPPFIFTNLTNNHDKLCKITVADQGSGLTKSEIQRIFEPFYSTKSKERGLGLTIIIDILKTSNGAIFIESAPNKGSKFNIYLPAYP